MHWLNISFSPCFIRVWLCCHCYHAAARVRKGLSGYSSHYWLLNLVMVVKALPVPFASEVSWWPALWACSTVHRCRGTIHAPFPFHVIPQRNDDWIVRSQTITYWFPICLLTWLTKRKKKQLQNTTLHLMTQGRFVTSDYIKWLDLHGPQSESNNHRGDGKSMHFSKFMRHFKKLSFFTIL